MVTAGGPAPRAHDCIHNRNSYAKTSYKSSLAKAQLIFILFSRGRTMTTATLPIPGQSSNGLRSQRVSRCRLSTTPPLNQDEAEDYMTDDSEEEEENDYLNDSTVQLMFNKIYVDPLQDEFEALDGEAGNILRTGKFSVTGETGSE